MLLQSMCHDVQNISGLKQLYIKTTKYMWIFFLNNVRCYSSPLSVDQRKVGQEASMLSLFSPV